jgi:hypothetical protein
MFKGTFTAIAEAMSAAPAVDRPWHGTTTPSRPVTAMCPACLTAAALAIAGTTSTGGLAALVVRKVRRRNRQSRRAPDTADTKTKSS